MSLGSLPLAKHGIEERQSAPPQKEVLINVSNFYIFFTPDTRQMELTVALLTTFKKYLNSVKKFKLIKKKKKESERRAHWIFMIL